MANFVHSDRDQPYLLPPDLRDWIPEDDLVHFVIEASEQVDLGHFKINRKGSGSAQYHPQMMLALLIYCYANGLFSSRRIERATYRDIAVRYLAANTHPDHDTICKFRRENEAAIKAAFVQVLLLAKELKLLKLGTISLDGTKLKANASKHRSIRYDRAGELTQLLEQDIEALLKKADEADRDDSDDDNTLPKQLARRERLKRQLEQARAQLERQAQAQAALKQSAYEEKCAARALRQGRRKGGMPQPPNETPEASKQINLTDPDSGLMRKNSQSSYEQSYNAQAAVDAQGSYLIVGCGVSVSANDRHELVNGVSSVAKELGQVSGVLADSGYADGGEVKALKKDKLKVLVSTGRESRRRRYDFRPERKMKVPPKALPSWIKEMNETMALEENRQLYRKRQETVEPVFGVIKSVLGFRSFLLRGVEKVKTEWQLVALAYNCKRLHRLCS